MTESKITLYRRCGNGSISIQEIHPHNFSNKDEFREALDLYYEDGYFDSYEEAMDN